MKKLKSLFQIILIVGVCFIVSQKSEAQSRVNQLLIAEAERISKDNFPVSVETPKGAHVFAVNQPNAKMLNAIEQGLTDLFVVARKNNYFKRLNYSDYTIFIAKPDRTIDDHKQYSPDIAVPSAQYAESVYDHGGFIYAAGMVLAYNPCAFIIAEHEKNLERVSNVVRYEGEHLVLYYNDRRRHDETADHSRGGGHPILQ
jgi:hypothetical protein